MALVVRNPLASAEDVRNVGSIPGSGRSSGEGAAHSSVLTWRIPWTEEPSGCSPRGHKESDTAEVTQPAWQEPLLISVASSSEFSSEYATLSASLVNLPTGWD